VAASLAHIWELAKLVRRGGPAICNVAVTNSCNATCEFCNFAHDKGKVGKLRWIDPGRFRNALDILHARHIRYINFFGGETLLHPRIPDLVAMAAEKGMGPVVITNGWLLPKRLEELAQAGLRTVVISIDSACMDEHEANRGLKGLGRRIAGANARMPALGMQPFAQVTMSHLVSDYDALIPMLRGLGFVALTFSYPQNTALGSTTLAWSSESKLVNFTNDELESAFEAADALRDKFPVNNPRASMQDMRRHLRGAQEHFECYGGYKSFYMDWNYDIWRCDRWSEPMCSVWEFGKTPDIRDGCKACIADCYRDSSVMLHFAVSLGDACDQFARGEILTALKTIADKRNFESLDAIISNAKVLAHRGRVGPAKAASTFRT
jgi:MoaA/NifB/PqqE/SkfB family radical SAM enzyme